MAKIAGRSIELENKLCELFDIDPGKTLKVSIVIEAGDIARVVSEQHLMANEVEPLIALLKEHRDDFKVTTVKTMKSSRRRTK